MAAATGIRVSFNATANYNTGTYGAPVWVAIAVVGSVKLDISFKEADASVRGGGGIEFVEPTLLGIGIDFDLKMVPSNVDYVAIRTKFLTRVVVDMTFSSIGAATTGEFTLRGDFKATKFGQDENLDGIIVNNCTVKNCYSANPVTFAQNP